MRFISTKVHAILDYSVSLILIASPWILGFNRGGAETYIPVILGLMTIMQSLFTDYELSLSRKISMNTHLTVDVISGIFLAVSPWLFGFNDYVYLPHLVFGLMEIAVPLMTKTSPSYKLRTA